MKSMKVWMMLVVMVAAGCAVVEEPVADSEAGLEGSGPADNMAQRATRGTPDEPVADAEAAPTGPAAGTSDTSSDTSGPNDTTDDADDAPGADTNPGPACTPDECGPGLLAPTVFCSDGSTGGPVCERDVDGNCGWDIRECPDGCTEDECGPQTLRAANILCADGSMGGPVCGRDAMRMCGWYYRSCPEACPDDACGDKPDYLQICRDGTELHPVCTVDQDPGVDAACSWKLPTCP